MKEQLEAIKNPRAGNREDNSFWKVEVGDHQFRLLTLPSGDIMRDYHWHYNLNGKNYLCAKKSFNKDCPVCDLASNIWKEYVESQEKGAADESLKDMAKELFASKRFYFPVLVRGLESEGAKVYSCGTKAAEQIFQIALDPDNSDMFDAKKGFDLKLTYALSNPKDRRTASTTITPSRKSSALLEGASKEEIEALFASIPDFDTLFEAPNPDDVVSDLDSYITAMDDTVSDSIGTEQYSAESTSPVKAAFERLQAE